MGACKEVPKQCIFHLREGEVQMLEHHLKQYNKSTPRALLCTLLKKKINVNCICFQKYSKLLY